MQLLTLCAVVLLFPGGGTDNGLTQRDSRIFKDKDLK